MTKDEHLDDVLARFREEWMSKDSPQFTTRQKEQYKWLFLEIWDRSREKLVRRKFDAELEKLDKQFQPRIDALQASEKLSGEDMQTRIGKP